MTTASGVYDELIHRVRETATLAATASLLSWDQETMMPAEGLAFRSQQLAQISRMAHEMGTDPRVGELLTECESDIDLTSDPLSPSAVNLREIRRGYDRATRLPSELVEEFARTTSMARAAWAEARKTDAFHHFKPWLEKIVVLLKRKAKCYGWPEDGEPWDALAEGFEPGMNAKQIERVFTPLRKRLAPLVAELADAPSPPSDAFHNVEVPADRQMQFCRYVVEQFGFDFRRGRLDISAHPFCSGINNSDVRMTTRFRRNNLGDALGSTMHESGHGMYEQGLPGEHQGTPMGDAVGLSIHESQSRMWENFVGRSRAFWRWAYPKLGDFFGNAFGGISEEEAYGAANLVRPGLIRVEADEATYNLHIMIRFELERAILSDQLAIDDLPHAWREKYSDYLGIDVPCDADGCLQDTHWSLGAMGYFPTYTLGNLYAAQFFEKALEEMPDLYDQFAIGQFAGLRTWLNKQIHSQGMRHLSEPLCERVTGKPLSHESLMRHLEGKLRPLYGL